MIGFAAAFDFVMRWEGGYANNPNDRGGATKFGISQKQYPDLDIEALTEDQAREIYRRDYWLPAHCPKIPVDAQVIHFDAAVHSGPARAVQFLQRALNITDDGIYGRITNEAIWNAPYAYTDDMIVQRLLHMQRLFNEDPTQQVFAKGWYRRIIDLRRSTL